MAKQGTFEFATERSWDGSADVADDAVGKVLVVGDIHGNAAYLADAVARAVGCDADVIVQVGDFWLADRHWSRFSAAQSNFMQAAFDSPVPIIVVDGNHEVWPSLGRYALTSAAREARAARRPLHLGGSLWWAWRGSVWHWGGRAFAALGGAVSIAKDIRERRPYRWSEEATTRDDVEQLIVNADAEFGGRLDVLFTHDAPSQVRGLRSQVAGIPVYIDHEANDVRRLLAEAVERTQPELVLHGHWHQANREHISERTEVFGLAEDARRGSTALLSTRTLTVHHS